MKTHSKKSVKKAKPASAASNSVLNDASRHLMNTYKRSDMIFTHGRGCYVFDQNGKKYLDFLGGIAVNALGYSHPDLVKTIRREAGRAVHVSNLFHNPFQGPLAAKLAKWSGMDRAFFTNSGSEAVEGALKLARIAAKKKPGGATKTRFLAHGTFFSWAHLGRAFHHAPGEIPGAVRAADSGSGFCPPERCCGPANRNLPMKYAPSSSSRFRAKAGFIPSPRNSGSARARSQRSMARR